MGRWVAPIQVSKEQERLTQEDEILREQQGTDQILTGKGGELPALPLEITRT